jgi:dihydroorotase
MNSLIIRNATIINEGISFRGDVIVEGEYITYAGPPTAERIPEQARIIDARGLLLIPGVIDEHVHFREPGLTHKGDIHSESLAAVAGGVTSFMDMPNTSPQTVTNELIREKLAIASEQSLANYSFYIGATNRNLSEVLDADPSVVCGIKLFMGSSTGNMLINDEPVLRDLFSRASIPLACHCESESVIKRNTAVYIEKYGEDVPVEMHPYIRSREACYQSSHYAVMLAREYGTRLHLLHISTADELKLLSSELHPASKRITGEACLHHLWFDETAYEQMGTLVKLNPAIKTRFDREALQKGLCNDTIDTIATDHSPHTAQEKNNTYFKAPSGAPFVQHSLVAMLELWHRKLIPLETIINKMCHNPAIIYNIKDRGFIREGCKADICLINPDDPWTVSRENILYKCGWSPLEGTTFRSKVKMTMVNGTIVFDNGTINEEVRGQSLVFRR